jgi:type 1 glutamine amidotransferase
MRRALFVLAVLALLGAAGAAPAQQPAKKKLLVITESKGFVHDVVRRGKDGSLALVEKTFLDMAGKSGFFEAVVSQDSRKDITAENLKNFDAVWFYTSGELPLSDVQKADLLAFVRSGKGFGGCHSASDTFYQWAEYGELIGGYFNLHPWHQKVKVIVENKTHPATRHLGDSFEITDEIYQFKEPYARDKLQILMKLDPQFGAESRDKELVRLENEKKALLAKAAKLEDEGKLDEAKKLRKSAAGKLPQIRTDNDWALAWTRDYGKGRVFYTALGHREDVWRDPRFQEHVLGGLKYLFFLDNGAK